MPAIQRLHGGGAAPTQEVIKRKVIEVVAENILNLFSIRFPTRSRISRRPW